MTGLPIPARGEFPGPGHVIVDVTTGVDEQGRATFVAYWPTEQEWVPGMVRGQVFCTAIAPWLTDQLAAGQIVTIRHDERSNR